MEATDKRIKHMRWGELRSSLDDPSITGNDRRKVIMEMHKKLVLPLACLILGMFAVPMAMSLEGLGRQYGALLALLAFLVYYAFFSVSYSLGETGTVDAHYCLWLPNAIFLLLTAAAFYLAARGREINLPARMHTLALMLRLKKDSVPGPAGQ
jgi:lipopolysaccharide export system permease protein